MEIYLVIQILHVTSRFSETSRHLKALTSVNVGLPLLPIKQKLIEEIQTLHLKQPSIEANKFEYSGRFPYTTQQQWQVELALTNFCKLPLNLKESLTVFLPTTRIIIYLRLQRWISAIASRANLKKCKTLRIFEKACEYLRDTIFSELSFLKQSGKGKYCSCCIE